MTPEEVRELLTATLHGPLPQKTVQRMMATLAEWLPIVEGMNTDVKGSPMKLEGIDEPPEDDRLGLPEEASAVVLFPVGEETLDMRLIFPKGQPLNEPVPPHVSMALYALDYLKQVAENGPPGEDDEEDIQEPDSE
jgi:hypothetical protein